MSCCFWISPLASSSFVFNSATSYRQLSHSPISCSKSVTLLGAAAVNGVVLIRFAKYQRMNQLRQIGWMTSPGFGLEATDDGRDWRAVDAPFLVRTEVEVASTQHKSLVILPFPPFAIALRSSGL